MRGVHPMLSFASVSAPGYIVNGMLAMTQQSNKHKLLITANVDGMESVFPVVKHSIHIHHTYNHQEIVQVACISYGGSK